MTKTQSYLTSGLDTVCNNCIKKIYQQRQYENPRRDLHAVNLFKLSASLLQDQYGLVFTNHISTIRNRFTHFVNAPEIIEASCIRQIVNLTEKKQGKLLFVNVPNQNRLKLSEISNTIRSLESSGFELQWIAITESVSQPLFTWELKIDLSSAHYLLATA